MTPEELRKLAQEYADFVANARLPSEFRDRVELFATALRHYADHFEKKDKVERIIEAGEACVVAAWSIGMRETANSFRDAVAEYRKEGV